MFESFAQNGEDVVLWRALKGVEAGTYVDVGAADPDDDSVTKAFYLRGWSGINVEPADEHAARLRSERPRDLTVQVCAGVDEGSLTLHHVVGTGLSSVVEASIDSLAETSYEVVDVNVRVRRLDAILEEAGFAGRPIHFLKIDVEGFEESVLRGIDLLTWRPWVVVAESTAPRSTEQVHSSWEPLLIDQGYHFCLFDGLNRFYVATEHSELGPSLSFPAGVFDQPFVTPAHARLLREYENLLDGDRRLKGLYADALQAFDRASAELDTSLVAYQRLESIYQTTLSDYSRLERDHLALVAGHEELQHGAAELAAVVQSREVEVEALRAERDTLRHGISAMGSEADGLRNERDAARHEVELMCQTLSWRISKPLRAVRRRTVR